MKSQHGRSSAARWRRAARVLPPQVLSILVGTQCVLCSRRPGTWDPPVWSSLRVIISPRSIAYVRCQTEQQRIDGLDELLHQLFQERPVLPEIPSISRQDGGRRRSSSFSVLDCGCGQGNWIERFMEETSGTCDVRSCAGTDTRRACAALLSVRIENF